MSHFAQKCRREREQQLPFSDYIICPVIITDSQKLATKVKVVADCLE